MTLPYGGESHVGGEATLRQLSDLRGDALVDGVLQLARKHKPIHVSLERGTAGPASGTEPRSPCIECAGRLYACGYQRGVPIPAEWMKLPRLRVAVSIDGLPEHHDVRRKPAPTSAS